ncbi:NAD(P)H-dependent oxidoreductase [Henriciella aquimarina]|uniref:NAD(P)H-dependent oxidoreductase n=1 Tax=Henriciella aquimarina TaxID=545261 RepID=UPI0009FD0C97|nr:NAD(P)H-dependent oxidoreductase [Henriciella aquimarina]
MRLLTVFAHPFRDKYPSAVMEAFHAPLCEVKCEIDVLDLHREGFDPRFTEEDHAHFWGGPIPPEITAAHERVNKADRLAFIFPVYWWGMPALMKGWIERVFTVGWAYQFGDGVDDRGKGAKSSLLDNKPTTLIGIAGSKQQTYERYGYDAAMRTQIEVGTFAYCGIKDIESHLIFDVEGDHNADKRDAGLVMARGIAEEFIAPDRLARDAKADHLLKRAS